MAKILEQSLPTAPLEYDAGIYQRVLSDLEMSLTKINFPAVVSGEDDANALAWFLG